MDFFDASTASPDFAHSDVDDSAASTIQMQTENDSASTDHRGPSPQMIALDVLIGIAVAVNLVVLLTLLTSRKLRHGAAAALVVSLVAADIMDVVSIRVCLYVMWTYEMDYIGDIACKAGVFLDSMFGTMSIFMLVAIARERYLAVVKPLALHSRNGSPLRWGLTRSAVCWLLATILAVPDIIMHEMIDDIDTQQPPANAGNDTETDRGTSETSSSNPLAWINHSFPHSDSTTFNPTNATPFQPDKNGVVVGRFCDVVGPEWIQWFVPYRPAFGFVVSYVVPMTLIGYLYGRTAYTLATCSIQQGRGTDQEKEQRKKRFQAARSFIALVVIVVVCLLPLHVLALLNDYSVVPVEQLHVFAFVSFYMFAINVTLNAVMVCVLGQAYRDQLLKLFCIRRCMRRSRRAGRKASAAGCRGRRAFGGSRHRPLYASKDAVDFGFSDEHGSPSVSHSISSTRMQSISL